MTSKKRPEVDPAAAWQIAEEEVAGEGHVLHVLQRVQAHYGYVPQEVLPEVADIMELPLTKIFGAMTFYSQFYTEPQGKYVIKVCVGTGCHVLGSQNIIKELECALDVKSGDTTADGLLTLEPVACLGSCGLAPLCMFNEESAPLQTPATMVARAQELRDGKSTAAPSTPTAKEA